MHKKFRVMKFGGTSVGDAERIDAVATIVETATRDAMPVVVVSAVAGVTNALIELAESRVRRTRVLKYTEIAQLHQDILARLELPTSVCASELRDLERIAYAKVMPALTPARRDTIISFGERLSACILASHLNARGTVAKAFPAWDIGMITTPAHGNAEPLPQSYKKISHTIQKLKVLPIVTGFIGKSARGVITTLGRGGSDYTAAIIGTALNAESIQIWKEVDGIMTTDPRIVPNARVIRELAFEEASELAYFGAKVLHPKTILPAMKQGVPVQVLNTFKPEELGTTIVDTYSSRRGQSHSVEAFTFKKGVTIIEIHSPEFFDNNGLMARIFELFDVAKVSVDIIATSVASVSVTVDSQTPLAKVMQGLEKLGTVVVRSGKAIVCVVGGGMNAAGIAGTMFSTLKRHDIAIEMISQASSGISITFVVDEHDAVRAIQALHATYIH